MSATIESPWPEHRRRNRWAVWWFLLAIPLIVAGIFVFGFIAEVAWPDHGVYFGLFGAPVAWGAVWFWLGRRVIQLRCPRCLGQFYGHDSLQMLTRPNRCAECGLRMYEEP